MSKEINIHEFDPVIYPFKLWVIISKNLIEIQKKFIDPETNKDIYILDVEDRVNAFILSTHVVNKNTNENGFLVVFQSKKDVRCDFVVHESRHLEDSIWKYINEEKPGSESSAYLIEWLVKCIMDSKK